MQLFSSISTSLLLLGCVRAGGAATAEAKAAQALQQTTTHSAQALEGTSARSLASIDTEAAQASGRFFGRARANARVVEKNAATSASALGGSSERSLASVDTEAAHALGRVFEKARVKELTILEEEAATSASALASERSLASALGGSSERSLASVDSEAAHASGRFFEKARVKERAILEEEEAANAALQAAEGTAAVRGVGPIDSQITLNLENLDRGLVGALGDERRTASLVKVLKGETRGTLKSHLEEAAKRSPAVKEALEKASVTHPELAPILYYKAKWTS